MKVYTLTGALLDYWVARAMKFTVKMTPEGCVVQNWERIGSFLMKPEFSPTQDSDLFVQIVDDAKISTAWTGTAWNACIPSHSIHDPKHETWAGCVYGFGTYREATLKCRVTFEFGEEVPDLTEEQLAAWS